MAGLVASLVGWLIQDTAQPYLGLVASAILSLVSSGAVFFGVRKWLRELRGD